MKHLSEETLQSYLVVPDMVGSFDNQWDKKDEQTLGKKVKDTIKTPAPLKLRMETASKRIKTQLQRLEQETNRFNERDKALFKKVVDAFANHDSAHANVYANELAEIRKMAKTTMNAQMALEQIMLRIETASELGDLTYTLLPVISVIREIKVSMESVNPQIAKELGDIGNILSGLIMDVGATTGIQMNFGSANEDAQKIVEEAAVIANKRMQDTFPEIPGKEALR